MRSHSIRRSISPRTHPLLILHPDSRKASVGNIAKRARLAEPLDVLFSTSRKTSVGNTAKRARLAEPLDVPLAYSRRPLVFLV